MERLLDTREASGRLKAHGVKRAPATLRKLRCTGGGPKFRRLNGKPYYTEDDLVAWIEERLSEPVGSTSEADARTAATRSLSGQDMRTCTGPPGSKRKGCPSDKAAPRENPDFSNNSGAQYRQSDDGRLPEIHAAGGRRR
jgi:hypothetical protein